MNDEDKKFVINAFRVLNNDLIKQLNKNFTHVSKRFDDMDARLCAIENRLNMVAKDTDIIPSIFSMLEEDGVDIAKLENRISKLEE